MTTRPLLSWSWPCFAALVLASVPAAQRGVPRWLPRVFPAARGDFHIVSCSLGCTAGTNGLVCTTSEIHVNEEVRVTFNRPVDPASVNTNSFQVIELRTGRTPASSIAIDPGDPNTIRWRPQLTFDSAGNPLFGLTSDGIYLLKVPGQQLDPLGPYLTSLDGLPNQTRLQCTLIASLGVTDVVPGRPLAKISVQVVTQRDPVTGQPTQFATVPAAGATDVFRGSPIRIVFGDLMNPATLANPVTGQSSFVRVFFDPDGDVTNASDQVPVPGSFALSLDQAQLATHAVFQAQGGVLPASGTQREPGRVVVVLSPLIEDLAGNTLVNPGITSFTTEAR